MRSFLFIIIVSVAFSANGQLSQGGYPLDWRLEGNGKVIFETLPEINLEKLEKEDEINDRIKNIPFRFGQNIAVDFDIHNNGSWTLLENGDRNWRLGITSAGAQSINFVFDKFIIPEGGKVFVYDAAKTQLLGSFTNKNANNDNTLGVGFVMADSIVISYFEPAEVAQKGYLHINNITHGYRNAFAKNDGKDHRGVFGNSGPCHLNVNCPEGLPFDIQKRSVGLIVVNGNSKCSGALVNTTAQDGRPYFLTARHCLGNSDNWVIYFNHETPDCDGQIAAPTHYSMSGTSLLAWNDESDFALVELNDDVPDTFNVCYSGWDATDNPGTVLSTYGIHHPKGDVKKISIDYDFPTQTEVGSFVNKVWLLNNWEIGATEGGSSGSPLFNQSGLIVGQLAGGMSMCVGETNNGKYDFYGRLGVSWNYGSTPATRLKDWLDPIGNGQKIVGNSCATSTAIVDASLAEFSGVEETTCTLDAMEPEIRVLNSGTVTIENLKLKVTFNQQEQIITWQENIDVFESAYVDLGILQPQPGLNMLSVEILEVNGLADSYPSGNVREHSFYGFNTTEEVFIQVAFDNYPLETSWHIENSNGEILYKGSGNYDVAQISKNLCLGNGCYKFVIKDSDGICCSYGQGWYMVTGENNVTYASGGSFSTSESTNFCIVISGTENNDFSFLNIYPNPSSHQTQVFLGDTAANIKSIRVVDTMGKTLLYKSDFNPHTRGTTIETSGLSAGMYLVVIETQVKTVVRKLTVVK